MARKIAFVTIDAPGRDQGKMFKITEMPASQAEDWASRLLLGLAHGNADVPPGVLEQGMAGIAILAIRGLGGIPWHDAKPLLDEMMQSVLAVPNPQNTSTVRPLVEDDIEELSTRLKLRDEWVRLHTSFSISDVLLNSTGASDGTGEAPPGQNIETFRARSGL